MDFYRNGGFLLQTAVLRFTFYAELVKPVQVEPEGKEYDDVHVRAEETRVELEVSKDAQDHSGKRGLALLEREREIDTACQQVIALRPPDGARQPKGASRDLLPSLPFTRRPRNNLRT